MSGRIIENLLNRSGAQDLVIESTFKDRTMLLIALLTKPMKPLAAKVKKTNKRDQLRLTRSFLLLMLPPMLSHRHPGSQLHPKTSVLKDATLPVPLRLSYVQSNKRNRMHVGALSALPGLAI